MRATSALPLAGFAWAALGLLAASAPARAEQAAAPGRFDGAWGIEVATARGGCDPLSRFYVVIERDAVHPRSMMGETSPDPVGRVQPDGRIDGRLGAADDPVVVRGRLSERAGSGTWSAPAKRCSGRWSAAKRS